MRMITGISARLMACAPALPEIVVRIFRTRRPWYNCCNALRHPAPRLRDEAALSSGSDMRLSIFIQSRSVGVSRKQGKRRSDQDLYVQPQGPVVDVVQVFFDTLLHLFQRLGLAPKAADLGQDSDTGLDPVPGHVSQDLVSVIRSESV